MALLPLLRSMLRKPDDLVVLWRLKVWLGLTVDVVAFQSFHIDRGNFGGWCFRKRSRSAKAQAEGIRVYDSVTNPDDTEATEAFEYAIAIVDRQCRKIDRGRPVAAGNWPQNGATGPGITPFKQRSNLA